MGISHRTRFATLALPLVLVLPAGAQDSVSKTGLGLPGDGLSPYATTEQLNTYVVDLSPLSSSWGRPFGIAPIVKASKASSGFFNARISAQGISPDILKGVSAPSSAYSVWTRPGYGVNGDGTVHTAPGTINVPSSLPTNQFALAFAEFDTTDSGASYNGVVGALVNYSSVRPERLFVSRIPAATNGANDAQNLAQFGFGVVDANGNTHFRADDFSTDTGSVFGNNIFRVDFSARSASAVNLFDQFGASDTGIGLITGSGTTYNTPGAMPASLAGRPVFTGSNFNTEYVYESSAGVTSTSMAHLGGSADHRGNVSYSKTVVFPGSLATLSQFAHDAAGDTRRILFYGVDANGAVVAQASIEPPATITDNSDSLTFPFADTIGEFITHRSQSAFRGGNGQVALGQDRQGRILVATHVATKGASSATDPHNAIAVARFDKSDIPGTIEWTLAAYVDPSGLGKRALDGPGGAAVGELKKLSDLTGGVPPGPSMSSPMIDSAGNIWFVAASTEFAGGTLGTGLFRAVYDPAAFSYELDMVAREDQTIVGRNSRTPWRVTFSPIADSNSIDSAAAFSGNIIDEAAFGMDPTRLTPKDPRTLGGIVWNATITYDVNADGVFDSSSAPDESYSALLYVGSVTPGLIAGTIE